MKKKIEINPTRACNFRCKYCYEQNVSNAYDTSLKMSDEVIERLIEYIRWEYPRISYADQLTLVFYGGECLLGSDVIDKIISSLAPYDIRYNFSTNGSLVDSNKDLLLKWKDLAGRHNIDIGISYDYFLQEQNRCKNTYSKVRDAIRWLDSNNFIYQTNTVFPKENLKDFIPTFEDYLQLQKELKHPYLFKCNIDNGRASSCNLQITYDDLVKISEPIQQYFIAHPEYINNISWKMKNTRVRNCGLGWRVICGVDYDGSVYPCNGSIFMKPIVDLQYGSIFDDFFKLNEKRSELLNKLPWHITNKCRYCPNICTACPLNTIKSSIKEFNKQPSNDFCKTMGLLSRIIPIRDNYE